MTLFKAFALLHAWLLFYRMNCQNTTRSPIVGYGGMVGSAHYLATKAGIDVLRNGGNAADAALAIQMALNVVQPMMSGIGGGCFIIYYNYSNKAVYAIDGREEAPNKYHGKIFCKNPDCLYNAQCAECIFPNQTATHDEKRIGGLSVGIPGTLYAFYNLYKYFGSNTKGNHWSDLIEPAIKLSFDGFPMYREMHTSLSSVDSCMRRFNDSYKLFYNPQTDEPIDINETFLNPDFGKLLQIIQKDPDDAIELFYRGQVAETIVNATQQHLNSWEYKNETVSRPGVMRMEDISTYRAVFRRVAWSDVGDTEYRMYGMNMPSSGSVTVQYLMNLMYSLMNKEELSKLNGSNILNEDNVASVDNVHFMITANNIAFSDRNQYMADADFIDVPIDGLLDKDYINERADYFNISMVKMPIPYGDPKGATLNNKKNQTSMVDIEHGTSHFFVVDEWNNIATVTTTIEGVWGSCIVVPKYGFLLNNELTDFDAMSKTFDGKVVGNGPEGGKRKRKTALNIFGLNDTETVGGKRPRSSMSPSLILNKYTKQPVLSIGSVGGETIIATTFETMFNVLMRKWDVQKSVDSDRIWSFNNNDIRVEQSVWENAKLRSGLQAKGYDLSMFSNRSHGTCQAVQLIKTKSCKGNSYFYVLNGAADDLRWSTASVEPVCIGSSIDLSSDFCIEQSNVCINTLTNTQRTTLIAVWLVLLIIVLIIVSNRDKIRAWRQKQKNKKAGYLPDNDTSNKQYISKRNDKQFAEMTS